MPRLTELDEGDWIRDPRRGGEPVAVIGWGQVSLRTRTMVLAVRDQAGRMRADHYSLDEDLPRV